MDAVLHSLREVNVPSIFFRILLAIVIGGALGLERGKKNRPAGFRTYMLVCLGASMVMMTNQYAYQRYGLSDPVRMGAQVVSGIGFLGAGTILVTGKRQIKGITTAAGLWTAACCGLAVGIGFYEAALIGGGTIYLVMGVMQNLDERIHRHSKVVELYVEFQGKTHFSSFIAYVREHSVEIFDVQIQKNEFSNAAFSSVLLMAKSQMKRSHSELLDLLSQAPGVLYIEELQ